MVCLPNSTRSGSRLWRTWLVSVIAMPSVLILISWSFVGCGLMGRGVEVALVDAESGDELVIVALATELKTVKVYQRTPQRLRI